MVPYKTTEAARLHRKKYYTENSAKEKASAIARRKVVAAEVNLKKTACVKCGECRTPCLDFHHRDKTTKLIEISKAVVNGWSRKTLMEEIDKCDIMCSNCHRL